MDDGSPLIRVCKLAPEGGISFPEIEDDPMAWQDALGGYMEVIGLPETLDALGFIGIVDEEGRVKELPLPTNAWWPLLGDEVLVGPVFIAKAEPPELVSLSDADEQLLRRYFR